MPPRHPVNCQCTYHGGGATRAHDDGCPRLIPAEPPRYVARALRNREVVRDTFLVPQQHTIPEDTGVGAVFLSAAERRGVQRVQAELPELTTAAVADLVDNLVEEIHNLKLEVSAPPAAYDQAAASTLAAVDKRLEALERLVRDAQDRPVEGPVLTDDVIDQLSSAMVAKLPDIATEAMVTVGTVTYTADEILTLIAEIAERAAAVEFDRNLRALGMKTYDDLVIDVEAWEQDANPVPARKHDIR